MTDDGTVLRYPPLVHACAPPVKDWTMTPLGGPSVWPSLDRVRALVDAGCTHYVLRGGVASAAGDPWSVECPVHVPPRPAVIGTMAAEPIGTLWRCYDCGASWVVRRNEGRHYKGGYAAGGPPKWYRASRRETRRARVRRRARLIARLRARL